MEEERKHFDSRKVIPPQNVEGPAVTREDDGEEGPPIKISRQQSSSAAPEPVAGSSGLSRAQPAHKMQDEYLIPTYNMKSFNELLQNGTSIRGMITKNVPFLKVIIPEIKGKPFIFEKNDLYSNDPVRKVVRNDRTDVNIDLSGLVEDAQRSNNLLMSYLVGTWKKKDSRRKENDPESARGGLASGEGELDERACEKLTDSYLPDCMFCNTVQPDLVKCIRCGTLQLYYCSKDRCWSHYLPENYPKTNHKYPKSRKDHRLLCVTCRAILADNQMELYFMPSYLLSDKLKTLVVNTTETVCGLVEQYNCRLLSATKTLITPTYCRTCKGILAVFFFCYNCRRMYTSSTKVPLYTCLNFNWCCVRCTASFTAATNYKPPPPPRPPPIHPEYKPKSSKDDFKTPQTPKPSSPLKSPTSKSAPPSCSSEGSHERVMDTIESVAKGHSSETNPQDSAGPSRENNPETDTTNPSQTN